MVTVFRNWVGVMIRKSILQEINDIVGKDCKYEDSYLNIEIEIDKISSVTQDTCDFRTVLSECENLLSKDTKDFKIATWWFYTNFKINQIEGLKYSIDCFIEFINKFYTSFYPKSKISKTNIIEWLETTLTKEIENNLNLQNSLKDSELEFKIADLSLSLKKVSETDRDYFKTILKLIKKQELTPKINKEKIEVVETIKVADEKQINENKFELKIDNTITNDFDANKVLRSIKKSASSLSDYYRQKDYSNFKSIRITRFISLIDIEDIPTSQANKTQIQAPLIEDLQSVEKLFKQNKYYEALNLSEKILEDCPFWLDGHFYTYQILEKTNYIKQANEVKLELLNFIELKKGILNLTFADGTPFASLKTKTWIDKENKNRDKEEFKEVNEEKNIVDEIHNFISNNNEEESISFFEEKISLSKSMEEKFNTKVEFLKFVVSISRRDIANIYLEHILDEIKYFNLDSWNPKLVSRIYSFILTNFRSSEYHKDKIKEVYKKLCIIDMHEAYKINLK